MKFIVPKKQFIKALERCAAVADRRGTMPVLANVLIDAAEGGATLKATDLVLAVTTMVDVEVKDSGCVCAPAKDLLDRVKAMPEGSVEISEEDSKITVKSTTSARRFTVQGVPGSEFPVLAEPSDDDWTSVSAGLLARLIAGTHFAISTDTTRLHMSSALFETGDGRIKVVATDGHRLAVSSAEVESAKEESLLIPGPGVREVRRLCEEAGLGTVEVELQRSAGHIFVRFGDSLTAVKLVDVAYVPYAQVIPAQSETKVTCGRLALASALKAVSLAGPERTGGVKVSASGKALRIESESPEAGEGFDEIEIEKDGPDFIVGVNSKYMLDVLGALTEDRVSIKASGDIGPLVIEPVGESKDYMAIVMPMRI